MAQERKSLITDDINGSNERIFVTITNNKKDLPIHIQGYLEDFEAVLTTQRVVHLTHEEISLPDFCLIEKEDENKLKSTIMITGYIPVVIRYGIDDATCQLIDELVDKTEIFEHAQLSYKMKVENQKKLRQKVEMPEETLLPNNTRKKLNLKQISLKLKRKKLIERITTIIEKDDELLAVGTNLQKIPFLVVNRIISE